MNFITDRIDSRVCRAVIRTLERKFAHKIFSIKPVHEVLDFAQDSDISGFELCPKEAISGIISPSALIRSVPD